MSHTLLISVAALSTFVTSMAGAETATMPPEPAVAQAPPAADGPKNFLGASVMGFAGFLRLNVGSFEVYYERLLSGHHGLRLAFDFVHVHHSADYVQSHQWNVGGNLGYRYYFGLGLGPFLGGKFAYRRGPGHYIGSDGVHTHLQNEQILGLVQGGYRFVLPRAHLSLVPALALGYGQTSVYPSERYDDVTIFIAQRARDNLATTPVALDLELSLAYAF